MNQATKLYTFLSYASDLSQQKKAALLWEDLKEGLPKDQRLRILTAWSKFLRTHCAAPLTEIQQAQANTCPQHAMQEMVA